MVLNLTTWERLCLVGMVSNLRDLTLGMMRSASKTLDVLELSESEREQINFRQVGAQLQWDADPGWSLEFDSLDVLQFAAKAHKYGMAERGKTLLLLTKLGLEDGEIA